MEIGGCKLYLKSVEIQGFKSFADKTKLEFGPGITAVVGPNGSGKSNISDCIRWVLGEQSAKTLRGTKMEDVIFAGSPHRKPLSMAEVSLTLDNSSGILNIPYQEVTVSRRVFRSGEAEYLINKIPCRLKDVQDLFNDTGLGKGSFAIIGQGKVEEILNSKPEERRALIEEAAGIVKYRNRKRDTLKKLEETEQNLFRVRDIIAELSSNLEPLKIAAEKALQYKSFKNELDTLEIGVAKKKLSILYEKLTFFSKEIQTKTEQIEGLELQFSTLGSQVEKEKFELHVLEEDISIIRQRIADLKEQANKFEHFLAVSEERQRFNDEQSQRLLIEIAKDEEQKNQLEAKYKQQILASQELQEKITQERNLVTAAEEQISELKLSCNELSNLVDKLKGSVFDSLQALANVRNRYSQISFEKENYLRQISKNGEKIKNYHDEIAKKKAELKKMEESLGGKEKQLKETFELIERLKQKKRKGEAGLKDFEEKLLNKKEEIQKLSSRQQALIDLQNDYEGYFQGVKAVLKAKKNQELLCQGIVGVVGELITVPVKYEQAIEVALGNSIQSLVALDDKSAENAISYLKRYNCGRATFLPLNTIKIRVLNEKYKQLLKENGVIGLAAELVNLDPKYTRVAQHLLGNVLVTNCLTIAREVSKKAGYNVKIVTLDGDIVNIGGSLTGGSPDKKKSFLLSRTRIIDELNKEIVLKKEEKTQIEQKITENRKNFQVILNQLEKLEAKTHKDNMELVALKQNYENTKQELAKLEKELEFYQKEDVELAKKLDTYNKNEEQLLKKITELENQSKALEEEYYEKQRLLKSEEEKNRSQYDLLTSLKIKMAGLLEKEKVYQAELSDYYKKEEELNKLIADKHQDLAELKTQKQELGEEIQQKKAELKATANEIFALQKELSEKESRRENLRAKIEGLEQEQRLFTKKLEGIKEALQEQRLIFARLETEKKNEEARLEEKFQISYADIKESIDETPETIEKIKKLKRQIAKLGEINLTAIEEYKRQKERHDFLAKQENDLREAKSTLNTVITEVDQIMTKRFAGAFEEVNNAFGDIYQKLFGGGTARLQLANPEDLLETGIDIIVQPPGKKLQNLALLSGGERALTVIALLFALLSFKPSPFCVLDEIEASLDETNVERFSQLLKLFAEKTQFIVISHRQGTMEVSDALYGVTMEEAGVSKIVSVRLTEEGKQEFRSA
jgi:chromosome segregation protein